MRLSHAHKISEPPKERPRLNLAKRTVNPEERKEDASSSSIFGGAKPVDTARKEAEIEQRLNQEQKKIVLPKKNEKSSSVFGGAKPVDTRAREQEVEENLRKMSVQKNGEDRGDDRPSSRGSRSSVEKEPQKPSSKDIFGAAKPVDTTARQQEIEERLRAKEAEMNKDHRDDRDVRRIEIPSDRRGRYNRGKLLPRVCIYKVPHGRQFNKRVGLTAETGSRGVAIHGDWTPCFCTDISVVFFS